MTRRNPRLLRSPAPRLTVRRPVGRPAGDNHCTGPSLVVNIAAMRDEQHVYGFGLIVDAIDNAVIADAVAPVTRQVAAQSPDIRVIARISFDLSKSAGELAGQRTFSGCEEALRPGRQT